ncbi:MAG TPA: TetR family transcriptional regulator [Solirubrobacterales bacterium]|nr:TetR family transcriptional regulator [Solirubrobacterales bacterium]
MAVKLTPKRAAIIAAARAERLKILESGLPLGELPEPEGKGSETKSRILDTSITLFAERGFEACTMRDIAAAVGIKAPAIYNHYSSKDDVLAAAMEHILGRFFWTLLSPLEQKPVEGWLKSLVCSHVGFQLEHSRLSRANDALLNAPSKERVLPPAVYHRIVGVERSYVELISILVRLAVPRSNEWDGLMSGFAITAMCDRVVAWYDPKGPLEARQVADRTWKLVSRMVGASA